MSNFSLQIASDIRYKNAIIHDCIWYKQNIPRYGRGAAHLGALEDRSFVLQRIEIALPMGVIIRASSRSQTLPQVTVLAKVGNQLS